MSQKTIISLANEVLRQSSSDSTTIPLDLCVYLLELKLLELSKDISTAACDPALVDALVKECVSLLKENSLSMNTLKLQLFWKKKYKQRDEMKRIHHERIFKNVLPLLTEITEETLTKAVDKDRLYKKIVIFTIMYAGLGSPSHQSILKETQAALNSIFKTTEVENFLSLSKTSKEQQLIEFARLITGIMLFTKDCKKGGEGMDDLPLILTQGVQATKERLIGFKDQLEEKYGKLVNFLQQKYSKDEESLKQDSESEKKTIPPDFQNENFNEFKTLVIYYRQIEFCLIDLIKDSEKSSIVIKELVQRLQAILLQVHSVVRYRVAVATIQVFPLFLQLSCVWVEMQEEVDILSEINNNFVDLSLASKIMYKTEMKLSPNNKSRCFNFINQKCIDFPRVFIPLKSNLSVPLEKFLPNDNDNTLSSETGEIRDCMDFYPGVKVCSITSVSNIDHFQYKGFCAWTLANTEGLLINGNVAIGVMQFSDRFYIFSSAEAAHKWALNPNHYIQTVLRIARVTPELIKFLSLESDLSEKLPVEDDKKPTTADSEVQTDLHPVESLIKKEYTFSEWELKRRVMKLATLTRCVTKSQQTAMQSCFRSETAVQATPCKSISTQTLKDGFCNHQYVPRSVWRISTKPNQFLLVPESELEAIKSVKN